MTALKSRLVRGAWAMSMVSVAMISAAVAAAPYKGHATFKIYKSEDGTGKVVCVTASAVDFETRRATVVYAYANNIIRVAYIDPKTQETDRYDSDPASVVSCSLRDLEHRGNGVH